MSSQPSKISRSRGFDFAGRLSRRRVLSTFAGSVAIAGTALTIGLGGVAEAQSKTSKKIAKYQDHPNKGQDCDDCRYFRPPHSCQLVEGNISRHGWCSFFAKKP
jgi:High potential iron-sulfur protein